jgi:hypothetical protein
LLKSKNYFAQRHNEIPAQVSNKIPAQMSNEILALLESQSFTCSAIGKMIANKEKTNKKF